MNKVNEIYDEMRKLWDSFTENHLKENNKAAAMRARKSIQGLKNLVSEYKKASMEETKKK